MSRELAGTRGVDNLLQVAVRHVTDVFHGQVVVLVPGNGGTLTAWTGGQFEVDANELGVARWVYEHRQPAGLGTTTLPGASALHVPLIGSTGPVGVLGLRPTDRHAMDEPERLHQLETFASQTALALERANLASDAQEAEVRIETERLRNSLLSSVSHDLRTPLATITGAVSTILDDSARFDERTRRELLESVHEEAERLNRLVENLLEMTRLESGALQLRRELHPPEEIIGAALSRLAKRLGARRITTRVPPDLPLVAMDDVLIEQVLVNLLDNAIKYTPAGGRVDISVARENGRAALRVRDTGIGIPAAERPRIWERLFRGDQSRTERGLGLGLSLVKAIVEAHGGTVSVESTPGHGSTFSVNL
jgi:two-component system sensor histidine kinase KdpD